MTDINAVTEATETETVSTISILTPEFVELATNIANAMVAAAEKARAAGDKKNICTKSQIVSAIGKACGIDAFTIVGDDGKLDNVRGGGLFDALTRMGIFQNVFAVQGPYGGVHFGTKPEKSEKKAAKVQTIASQVAKLSDSEKATLLASLQPAPADSQPTA